MSAHPSTVGEALSAARDAGDDAVLRAGGSDLQEHLVAKRATGAALPEIVELGTVEELVGVHRSVDGSLLLGAGTTIERLASSAALRSGAPALALAAAGLATPQVRAVATLGGNLLQSTRCAYVRNLDVSCWRTGGVGCPARDGVHDRAAVIDLGPCVAPHPSTMAAALLAHDATVTVRSMDGARTVPLSEVLGDGTDPSRSHDLEVGEVLVRCEVPPGWRGERGAYVRAASRATAEWALAEAVVRVSLQGGVVRDVAIAVGAVAAVPLRLTEVEDAVRGTTPTLASVRAAALLATQRCSPLPQTGYKVDLLVGVVLSALEQACELPTTPSGAGPLSPSREGK